MPRKSRQARRRLSRSKRRKSGQVSSVIAQQTVPQASKPAVPSQGMPTPLATPTVSRYPDIVTELRRIGILTGIILVILVVLALVLS